MDAGAPLQALPHPLLRHAARRRRAGGDGEVRLDEGAVPAGVRRPATSAYAIGSAVVGCAPTRVVVLVLAWPQWPERGNPLRDLPKR